MLIVLHNLCLKELVVLLLIPPFYMYMYMYTFKLIYWKSDSMHHTQLQNSHVHQNKFVCEWAVEDDFHFSLACNKLQTDRGHYSSKLPSDRLWLFRRLVNCWRERALVRILQLFTYWLNNHSRSRELRTFLYDVADL